MVGGQMGASVAGTVRASVATGIHEMVTRESGTYIC